MDAIAKIALIILGCILILELSILWEDKRGNRKLLAGITGAFFILVFIGFVFSLIGIFELLSMVISLLCIDCIIGIFLFLTNRVSLRWLIKVRVHPLVIILLFIAMQLLLGFPSMNMYGGRDDGLYFTQGIHIAKTGMFEYEEDQFVNENYEEISSWFELGYPGLYSKYKYGTAESYGAYEFQFMPLFPVALAIGYVLGEIPLLIRMNGFIGILALCWIYCFIRDYLGNRYHALLSCYCILLSPAFLWNTRAAFSEILAQCLFFCCFYLFAKGWDEEKRGYAVLSGIMIGLATLTRIDSFVFGLGILVTTFWICIFEKEKKYYMFTLTGTYILGSVLTILYGLSHNYSYLYDQRQNLVFMMLVQVIMLSMIGTVNFLFRNHSFRNFLLNKRIQNIFILIYLFVIFFLLVIRPEIGGDIFDVRAAKEFTWYTSVIVLLCVPIGIKAIINRNRDEVNRCMLFLFSAGGIFILYLIHPSISEDHMWASRRWVLLGIPFVMICFVNMMNFYSSQFGKIANALIVMMVAGYLISQDESFISTRIYDGIDRQYQVLADMLEEDKVYYTSNTRLATTLRFIFDKNVYYLDRLHHLSEKYSESELVSYLEEGEDFLYFIGDENAFSDERLQVSLISEFEIAGENLERTKGSYPRSIEKMKERANVYKITVKD